MSRKKIDDILRASTPNFSEFEFSRIKISETAYLKLGMYAELVPEILGMDVEWAASL